jgi:hypothetical protein
METFSNKAAAQLRTSVDVRIFSAGLLARSQFASGRSCDRPIRPWFFVVSLGLRAKAKLELKFRISVHASQAASQW